mgnify:CR=1 FL=1
MDFKRNCIDKLEDFYEVKKLDKPDIGVTVQYIVKNDTFGFKLYNESRPELVICVDNFPSPRKYFRSDLPINTFEDLEYNLKQAGIELVRNPKVLVFYAKEQLEEDDETDGLFFIAECKSLPYPVFVVSRKFEEIEQKVKDTFKNDNLGLKAKSVSIVFGDRDKRNFTFEL